MDPTLIAALIGGAGSLFGGLSQAGAASSASAAQQGQLELLKKAQGYQFDRQAQLDPIFLDLLSQALTRTSGVPKIAGAYGAGVNPLMAGLRGMRIPLPAPKLIGATNPNVLGPSIPKPTLPSPEEMYI